MSTTPKKITEILEATRASGYRAGAEAMREQAASAVEKRAQEIGKQECCGSALDSMSGPPECCGDPDLWMRVDDAAAAIRALPLENEGE